MHRYLAIFWDPLRLESVRTYQSFRLTANSKPAQWAVAWEGAGSFVMHTGLRPGSAEAYPLRDNGGVVMGRIFDRRRDEYATMHRLDIDAGETRRIVGSGGQHLVDRYWGAYFAVVHDESASKYHVFRDPLGNVPCYHTTHEGVHVFFSHIADCVRLLPMTFSVDRKYLVRWLLFSGLTGRDAGLENVETLPAGERLTLAHGRVERSCLWDPVAIARAAHLEQPEEAASALRSTVQTTVNAWASCYEFITHQLSGGLDSSIVAGCLAQAPSNPQITYLNHSIDIELVQGRLHLPGVDQRTADKLRAIAGHGDERHFARMVAERWGTTLIERQRTLCMDLKRLWQTPPTANPVLYYTTMELDDDELEMAKTHGAQAFFTGQGGDSVFLATQQPLPAIDYAYVHGLTPGLWQHLVATSKLSKDSLWSVLKHALRHGILRRPHAPPIDFLKQPTLVEESLLGHLTREDFQSDLVKLISRSSLPPGKRDHARGLVWSAYYDFVFESGNHADHIHPLHSQPVWELMLQIPICTVLVGGVSRGLARKAFADLLPAEIRKRQVKGTGGPFYQHLVRRNKDFLRATLLDGLLVEHGYLNRRRLEECLATEDPCVTISAVTLLNYLSAEIWLQQWMEIRQRAQAHGLPTLQHATS